MPQGSPISPLLSNIQLNELDKELERINARFVRYADGFSIYAKTEFEARNITLKTTPMNFGERVQKLNEVQRGWVGNFHMANILAILKDVDGWIRNSVYETRTYSSMKASLSRLFLTGLPSRLCLRCFFIILKIL